MSGVKARAMDYQSQLLSDIYRAKSAHDDKGLQIYQNNLHMTAMRSLSVTYPVLEQMVGEQAMFVLSHRLLQRELPDSGDWADWGRQLPELIHNSELYAEHPYLVDVTHFEWAFHQVSRKAFYALDSASLNRLADGALEQTFIALQPSLTCLRSSYPVHGLWLLHRSKAGQGGPSKQQLEDVMNEPETGCYVIAQGAKNTHVTQVNEEEFNWVQGISDGLSVAALLDVFPAFDFAAWIASAIRHDWITHLE
ncbi:HvfC/BufC family peptide modification chaperone [Alteromonas gilva]|uniref:DNA-binding domain-containing protein n=1 Tax=Alteromonas gilva TaxID=2987522 RepID=A0ABT5KZV1_9ALTE|nr:putative DNA-binding domain-containing protein [Alteromonas gilva]MDC8829781.1 putative DNA-binding domain-containing protein [Alteromonas gilva]